MPSKSMDELKAMVGESHQVVENMRIEAGKVDEFARAVLDDNPAHRDEDAAAEQGFENIPAPLTFTRTSYFDRYRPEGVDDLRPFDLGWNREYSVHGEQAYEFERPVMVGDILSATITLVDVYQREGSRGGLMTFAEFEIEYFDQNDELVVTERASSIETAGAIEEDADE